MDILGVAYIFLQMIMSDTLRYDADTRLAAYECAVMLDESIEREVQYSFDLATSTAQ